MGMGSKGPEDGPISDINVTPFVDVVLVLLVIFMLTAPMLLNGIALDLPQTKEINRVQLDSEQVVLSMTKSGEFFLGEDKVLKSEIIDQVKKRVAGQKNRVLYLRADHALRYGEVAKLMSFLKSAGISQLALVTEVLEDS